MPWQETRHGGLRRTREAQWYKGNPALETLNKPEAVRNAEGESIATPDSTKAVHHSDTVKVGGSTPSPRTFIVKLREPLGLPECPYVIRWRLETKWFSVRVHHWLAPDDDRAHHATPGTLSPLS